MKINNQQIDETDSKRLKISNRRYKKRKRRESSGKSIINYHKMLIDICYYIVKYMVKYIVKYYYFPIQNYLFKTYTTKQKFILYLLYLFVFS